MEIAVVRELAAAFAPEMQAVKARCAPPDFLWYPYGSLANFDHFNHLLTGENRRLLDLPSGARVADIGAADGDVAFFLESLGLRVDIVDFGPTNMNGLRGARLLREALGSSVTITETDLDSQFVLPADDYELVMFMGILYHLKNPFYALERLSHVTRHLLLSTRIARFAGNPRVEVSRLPVAYLLDAQEANNDATNFWIFTEAGLRRLLQRTGWIVADWLTLGDATDSNPSDNDHDERAFCLLRSGVIA